MLIGMELFAYRVKFNKNNELDLSENGVFPRFNFNTPFEAFLSVFIILANDGWSQIFYDNYRATEPVSTITFFVCLLVIGQYILINLFTAILIENFDQLSIRNNMINKIQKLRMRPLSERLTMLFCRRGRVKSETHVADDLINDDLQERKKKID